MAIVICLTVRQETQKAIPGRECPTIAKVLTRKDGAVSFVDLILYNAN
jgi:hypothetical protein